MIQNARIRTHSKSLAARLLCFAYSVAMPNVWVMVNAVVPYIMGIRFGDPVVTQQHIKQVLLECGLFDPRMLPEPPLWRKYICED